MNKKKKIIIVGPAYPYRGGNSLYISHFYDKIKNDFEVKIFNYKLLYPSFLFPGTTQFDKSESTIKKAPNERIINSINPFNWFFAAQRIVDEDADLVIFDWWHPFFAPCHYTISSLIKKHYKNKILFITENYISHEGNFVDKFLTKVGLSKADSFMVLSNKVEDELGSDKKNKKVYRSELPVYDCYNIDENQVKSLRNEFGFTDDNKVLLFFGYVRKYKGLDVLIKSFKDLVISDNNYRLLIAGEFYDSPDEYLNLIKDLKLDDHIILVNKFIANEEVYKYYLPADLIVLPYRSATQSGILNVAYGFLKPVVITNVGGLAEFIEDYKTGLVAEECKEELITSKIKEFFDIRNSINFEENISKFIKRNKFEQLPELLSEIIEDSTK